MGDDENKIFIEKFHPEKFGFFDLATFSNLKIGFSIKKRLNNKKDDNNITLLSIYIPDRTLTTRDDKKLLSIRTTYGEKAEGGGVVIREKAKLMEPVDAEFPDEYYYDIKDKEFFKRNKKILADCIINEIYNTHIKSTKMFKGLWIRTKIEFYHIIVKSIFALISKIFFGLLFMISGDRYTYEPILESEKLNNKVIKSKYEKIDDRDMKENLRPGEKFDFLGYKASRWSIIFYSILHFIFYIIFFLVNYRPVFLTTVFKNNFLLLVYAVLSLWIIEVAAQKCFKFLIRLFSKLAKNAEYRTIKL